MRGRHTTYFTHELRVPSLDGPISATPAPPIPSRIASSNIVERHNAQIRSGRHLLLLLIEEDRWRHFRKFDVYWG